jgi:hypothetical protein
MMMMIIIIIMMMMMMCAEVAVAGNCTNFGHGLRAVSSRLNLLLGVLNVVEIVRVHE